MKTAVINRTDRGEPINEHSWPKHKVNSVETRKRDLVIRIADWTRDKEEPAFEVEIYHRGIYDWNQSKSFTRFNGCDKPQRSKQEIRRMAARFACRMIKQLLSQ